MLDVKSDFGSERMQNRMKDAHCFSQSLKYWKKWVAFWDPFWVTRFAAPETAVVPKPILFSDAFFWPKVVAGSFSEFETKECTPSCAMARRKKLIHLRSSSAPAKWIKFPDARLFASQIFGWNGLLPDLTRLIFQPCFFIVILHETKIGCWRFCSWCKIFRDTNNYDYVLNL